MGLIKEVWEIQYCSGIFSPRYILSDHKKWEQFQEDLHHFHEIYEKCGDATGGVVALISCKKKI